MLSTPRLIPAAVADTRGMLCVWCCAHSDVVCPYPMKDMLDFHTARGAEATILVTKVDDPSKYGECAGLRWAQHARCAVGAGAH